jgi:hypothetical protein
LYAISKIKQIESIDRATDWRRVLYTRTSFLKWYEGIVKSAFSLI